MFDWLLIPILLPGAVAFYFGVLSLFYFPLALAYVFWERRQLGHERIRSYRPRVTVLVPAYNEERTIGACIRSILASDHPSIELIVINDGSTDHTAQVLREWAADGRVRYVAQPNGGKASALNRGLALATGEIVLFTDADSLFEPDTIARGVAYLADRRVGAVSGNDTPLNPRGWLQRLLVVTSHIGTGFVRRALSIARVLPIIPGNLGLVRTEILRRIGGFREVWGEDLELTFRLHAHGVRVVYGSRTRVLAECPHTLRGLWKQRVRWIRSYIKVVRLHASLLTSLRAGAFGPFLILNTANLLVVPVIQALTLLALPFALASRVVSIAGLEWLAYLGFVSLLAAAIVAIVLDRAPRDFRHLPFLAGLVPLSHFYNAVILYSLWAELRTHREDWNKLERRDPAAPAPAPTIDMRRRGVAVAVAAGVGALALPLLWRRESTAHSPQPRRLPRDFRLAVSVHFSDWPEWRDALESLMRRPEVHLIDRVAVSAGRADWTFFRWEGRERWWSRQQRGARADMLEESVRTLARAGIEASAMLDAFAPRYLSAFPDEAAVDRRGRRSHEIVCSTALAQGGYGELLRESFTALAARTSARSLCVTELFYDTYCFDERCRRAFMRSSGAGDWPRTAAGGIDRYDPALARWRSAQVADLLERLLPIARNAGKRLLMDVKLSREDFALRSRENGQDYSMLLPSVDQLVVWDYFGLESAPPEASTAVASFLKAAIGVERYWHSIGLWGANGATIEPQALARALRAARAGGSTNLWITPARRLTDAHWRAIAAVSDEESSEPGASTQAHLLAHRARKHIV